MDGQTMQQVRDILLERWRRLGKSTLKDFESQHDEMNLNTSEIIDIAQSLEQLGRDASLAEQERRDLLAVERALAKMATGNFGICEDCAEEIPVKRLVVLPEARLCAQCQAVEERNLQRIRQTGMAAR